MNTTSFTRFLLVASLCIGLVGCASKTSVVPVGNGVYEATCQAGNGFKTSPTALAKLRDQAVKEATDYCSSHGKSIKIVSVNEDRPLFKGASLASVKVVFKPLDSNDPEMLQAEPAPVTHSVQGKVKEPKRVEQPQPVYLPQPQYVGQPGQPQAVPQPMPQPQYAPQPASRAVYAAPKPLSTDEMVNELTKLDDLRKKGILTEEEFQAEKRKILARSNN